MKIALFVTSVKTFRGWRPWVRARRESGGALLDVAFLGREVEIIVVRPHSAFWHEIEQGRKCCRQKGR